VTGIKYLCGKRVSFKNGEKNGVVEMEMVKRHLENSGRKREGDCRDGINEMKLEVDGCESKRAISDISQFFIK